MAKKSVVSGYSILAAIIAGIGGFLFGYHTTVISGAILFITDQLQLTIVQQEILVSILIIGALIGAFFGGMLADMFGRKKTLFLTVILFFIGTIFLFIADDFWFLFIGRIIAGVAIGIGSLTVPLYISEMSPPENRGALVSVNQLAITFGILISYGIDYIFAVDGAWRAMFGFAFFPAIVMFIGLFFIPETPSWLVEEGKKHLAIEILKKIHRKRKADEVTLAAKMGRPQEKAKWKHLIEKSIRPALFVGIGISIFQQITGINAVLYFAPTIFQFAGFQTASTAILATFGLGFVNFIVTIVALWIIDIIGRKPLLIFGVCGMILSLAVLAYTHYSKTTSDDIAAMISLTFYIAFFAISLGPVTWLIISEIYPMGVRGRAMGIATFANWIANYFVSFFFLTVLHAFGVAGSLLIFAVIGLFALWFIIKSVPETKGKTLEQIQLFWKKL